MQYARLRPARGYRPFSQARSPLICQSRYSFMIPPN